MDKQTNRAKAQEISRYTNDKGLTVTVTFDVSRGYERPFRVFLHSAFLDTAEGSCFSGLIEADEFAVNLIRSLEEALE
jgi:hypothetical protein